MSTILKALRRLERDKAVVPEGRSLQESVATGGLPEVGRGASWLTPGIALLLGVAVGAGLLLLWPDPAIEAGTPAVSARAAPVEVAKDPPPRLPDPVAVRRAATSIYEVETFDEEEVDLQDTGPPPGVYSSPVEVVARPVRQPRIAEPPPAPAAALLPEEPTEEKFQELVTERVIAQAQAPSDRDPSVEERYTPPRARPVARPDLPATSLPEPPIPVDPFPEPEPAEPQVAEPEIPTRRVAEPRKVQPEIAEPEIARESPAATQTPAYTPPPRGDDVRVDERTVESFPASVADSVIRVDRTWWHPTPERRAAQLRLDGGSPQRLKEGESVGGARVTRIEPSGVVFTRGDREFRRSVGQSE